MAVAEFIKPLSDMVWDAQTPKELIDQSTEKEYNDTKMQICPGNRRQKQGAKQKLIDFAMGYAWWIWQSCDWEEGQAMGHCGNNKGANERRRRSIVFGENELQDIIKK